MRHSPQKMRQAGRGADPRGSSRLAGGLRQPRRRVSATPRQRCRRARPASRPSRAGPQRSSRWRPPTRWPPTPATRCSRPAARPSTRPSRCRWCWRLVEPQSSGIGGGAFLLHYNGKTVEAFDGRETAPAAADEKLFLGADGKPMAFYDAVVGGRSVGTPGTVRMLEMAHRQYGKLPWAQLFEPAIRLAEDGFRVSPRLATLLKAEKHLIKDPAAAAYLLRPTASRWPRACMLQNPAYAEVLRKIAARGRERPARRRAWPRPSSTRCGSIRPTRASWPWPTWPATRPGSARPSAPTTWPRTPPAAPEPIACAACRRPARARSRWRRSWACSTNTDAHALPLVPGLDPALGLTPSADLLHLYTEASRLAFADRAQYLADPDFVQPPGGSWMSLLDPATWPSAPG